MRIILNTSLNKNISKQHEKFILQKIFVQQNENNNSCSRLVVPDLDTGDSSMGAGVGDSVAAPALSQLFLCHPGYSPGVISDLPEGLHQNIIIIFKQLICDFCSTLDSRSFQAEVQVMNGTISR